MAFRCKGYTIVCTLSDEQIKEIIRLKKMGFSLREIAVRFDMSHEGVRYILKKFVSK